MSSRRHTSPTASTGCTRPELVGTQVTATSAGRRRADLLLQGVRVDAALRRIGNPHNLDSEALRQRQVHDLVRGVVGAAGHDPVAGPEVEGGHRLGKGRGGILGEGDVAPPGADQGRDRLGRPAQLFDAGFRGLVTTQRRLPVEILRDSPPHRQRGQRRAGVVEMVEARHFRCLGAPAGEVGVVGRTVHRKALTISSRPLVHLRSSRLRAAARSPRRKASAMRP